MKEFDFIYNEKMGKRGNVDLAELIIRIIQIAAIVFAVFVILKAFNVV